MNYYRDNWVNTNTTGRNTYVVAECRGGIMEDPVIHYENHQIIRADSRREAEAKYNALNHCSYYYASVVKTLYEDPCLITDECGKCITFYDRRPRPFIDPVNIDVTNEMKMLVFREE